MNGVEEMLLIDKDIAEKEKLTAVSMVDKKLKKREVRSS